MKLFTKKNSNSMYDGKSSLNELANKFETDKGTADKGTDQLSCRPKAGKPSATTAPTPTKPEAKPRSSPAASSDSPNPRLYPKKNRRPPKSSLYPHHRNNPPPTHAPSGATSS